MKLKENIKPFVPAVIAAIFALVAFIGYTISETIPGYTMGAGVFLGVVVLVLFVAYAICTAALGSNNILTVLLGVAAIVVAIVLMGIVINGRVNNIAGVFSYDNSNPVAWKAVKSAIVAVVGLVLSSITVIISGFLGPKKAK